MERGGCCEERDRKGLLAGFYTPEKKIINDGICSRGMHAAFARPFFFPTVSFLSSPPQSKAKRIQYPRPNVPLNSSQGLIPPSLRYYYRAHSREGTKERPYSEGAG